jgi:phosphocarrier protein HPr
MEQTFIIKDPKGLHARPASLIAESAKAWLCTIELLVGAETADADSVVDLLLLGAKEGTSVLVRATGERETEALLQIGVILETIHEGE